MTRVLVMDQIKAVWRITNEVDPFLFGDATDAKKYRFLFALTHLLAGAGCTEFYFNIHADDEKFQKTVEQLGAQRTSTAPEFRYKLII